jgi:uncharacterized paraquat-inducible protein A
MFGNRCEECGEVRWSIFTRPENTPAECPACGAQMTQERRYPGHPARAKTAERRSAERLKPV